MMEDCSQPFFVPYDKRYLFRGVSASGYLPALEPKPTEKQPREPQSNEQLYKSLDQLKAEFVFIRNKFNQLYDKKKHYLYDK